MALRASRLSSNSLRAESETRDSSRSSFSWKLRLFRHGKPSKMMQNAKYSGSIANLFCKCCLLCLNIMEYCLPFVRSKSKALVDPQNQRTPLEMTKPLNPFETSRMLICLLVVARFLLPGDWISLDLFGLVHNDSVTTFT